MILTSTELPISSPITFISALPMSQRFWRRRVPEVKRFIATYTHRVCSLENGRSPLKVTVAEEECQLAYCV